MASQTVRRHGKIWEQISNEQYLRLHRTFPSPTTPRPSAPHIGAIRTPARSRTYLSSRSRRGGLRCRTTPAESATRTKLAGQRAPILTTMLLSMAAERALAHLSFGTSRLRPYQYTHLPPSPQIYPPKSQLPADTSFLKGRHHAHPQAILRVRRFALQTCTDLPVL